MQVVKSVGGLMRDGDVDGATSVDADEDQDNGGEDYDVQAAEHNWAPSNAINTLYLPRQDVHIICISRKCREDGMLRRLVVLLLLSGSPVLAQSTFITGTLAPYANGFVVESASGNSANINGQGFFKMPVTNTPNHTLTLTPNGSTFTAFSVSVVVAINQTTDISTTLLQNMPIPNPFPVQALQVKTAYVSINGLQYLWPTTQVAGCLLNDGNGNVSWSSGGCGGGSSGFPFPLGSTSISSAGPNTSVSGLTVDGVTPTTFGFLDATSSIQNQLNARITTIAIANANGISGSSSGGATPSLTLALGAITPSAVTVTNPGVATQWNWAPTSHATAAIAGNYSLGVDSIVTGYVETPATGPGTGVMYGTASGTKVARTYVPWPWSCQPGYGDGTNAVAAATYLQTNCYNDTGQTLTLTGIRCFSDNNGSSSLAITNGAGTALLTSSLTCTTAFAAGTQSGTTTIASGDFLKITFVADGTTKQANFVITGNHP